MREERSEKDRKRDRMRTREREREQETGKKRGEEWEGEQRKGWIGFEEGNGGEME